MSSRDPIPTIRQRLLSARVELALSGIVHGVAVSLWQWFALAVGIVVIDALWPTAPIVRFCFAAVLAAALARVLWRCVPARVVRRASPGRLAREIEQRCKLEHNPLITALQLQVAPSVEGPVDLRSLLLSRSAQRGENAAMATESTRLIEKPARFRSRIGLAAAFASLVLAGLIAPRPIEAVARRLVDPSGDHPPYTPLIFDVSFEPQASEIVYGDQVRARVEIEGGAVSQAQLVWRLLDGEERQAVRIALQPAMHSETGEGTQVFTAILNDCRESMQVMISTPLGRSAWMTLEPRREPRWAARTLTVRGPEYARAQEERRLPLSDRPEPVRVLQGSRLTVEATSTLPLRDAVASAGHPIDGAVGDDGLQAEWRWIATRTGVHEVDLALVGPTGLQSTLTHLRIDVLADAPPIVSIEQPPPRVAALPDQAFTARLDASDDVSVGQLSCTIEIERAGEIVERRVPEFTSTRIAADRMVAAAGIDLARFDLKPGDTVRLRATAHDERPDDLGGSQASASASCEILIIDEPTYAALAGRSAGTAEQTGESEEAPGEGSGVEGRGESAGESGEAEGGTPDEPGVELASGGAASESEDGPSPASSESPDAAGDSEAPTEPGGSNGGGESSVGRDEEATTSLGAGSDLLAEASRRSLIERDGSVQPMTGQTDPNGPREHLTAVDTAGAPPAPAASRATTRVHEASVSDSGQVEAGVPVRYRDLVARYFKRLAEQDRDPPIEETSDHE